MENKKRKEDLSLIYKMCMRDLENAKNYLENYTKKADEMYSYFFDTINNNSNVSRILALYDAILSDLTSLSDTARKFNISCELKTFKYDDVYIEKGKDNLSLIKKTTEEKERFTFPKPDMMKYENGYEGICVVTYIKDKEQKLFYINEMNNKNHTECVELLKKSFSKSKKYSRIPEEGEVFGLYIKDYLLRAVRENDQYNKNKPVESFNAYLIDIGEIIEITSELDIYFLPFECIKYPAQAVLCKLEMIDFNSSNVDKYFSNILYMQQKFMVLSRDDLVVRINLISNKNPFLNDHLEEDNAYGGYKNDYHISVVNPFRQYHCSINNNDNNNDGLSLVDNVHVNSNINNSNRINTQMPLTLTTSFLLNNNNNTNNNFNLNDDLTLLLNKDVQCSSENFKSFNDYDFNAIQQNDLSSSIKKNVVGTTNDDENSKHLDMSKIQYLKQQDHQQHQQQQQQHELTSLIKQTSLKDFYSSIYKPLPSSNCNEIDSTELNVQHNKLSQNDSNSEEHNTNLLFKLKTLTINQDDDKPVHGITDKLVYPSAGCIITLTPTHMINIELFFAHLHSHEARYQITLGELIRKMNAKEQISQFKMIKRRLEKFELVVAKYKDGYWYRARVIKIYDELNVKVFYVDYGNADKITVHQIRKWEKYFEFLPFQAARCQIHGIKSRTTSITSLEHAKALILNKTLRAKIINNLDGHLLDVKLTDSNGCDIANQLILMGYAYKKV